MPYIFSYLLVYYNLNIAAAIVALACKNTVFKSWTKNWELVWVAYLMSFAGVLSLIYSFEPILMCLLLIFNFVLLIIIKRLFNNYSYSGLYFYIANYILTFIGLIWGTLFITRLQVSEITRILLLITTPLVLLVLPSSVVQVLELYDVLCREVWLRPRNSFPSRTKNTYPMVSLHVPTYSEPPEIVIETLNKLNELDYKNFEVIVIDNNTKDSSLYLPVKEYCKKLGNKFKFYHVENLRGAKAGALNYILPLTSKKAEIIGIIDADYQTSPNFLKALVGHFDNPKVGFVQTPHDYRDWENNWFLRMCYWEYKTFFYSVLVSLNERKATITVGTMCLIRKQALIDAGGWAEWCVTEDSELAIRIHDAGYSSIYVPTSYGKGLIPDTFEGYRKQRHRWTAGPIQEFKYHIKHLSGLSKKPSLFSRIQRIHHINHGLNNVIVGLTLPLTIIALSVIFSMVIHHEIILVPFELWLSATIMLFASLILDLLVNKTVINPSIIDMIGKIFASKSLTHTITLSAFNTLVSGNASWNRTNKFKSNYSYIEALYSTKEELLLGIYLIFFIFYAYKGLPTTGLALMFLIGLSYTAISYFAAPIMGLVSAWTLKKDETNKSIKDTFTFIQIIKTIDYHNN